MGLVNWAAQLLETAGVEQSRLEAQLLVAHALSVSRASAISETYAKPTEEQLTALHNLVRRRSERVPLSYLTGAREFYGLQLELSPDVLIPRPETELLVEIALATLQLGSSAIFADVGVGSGCILVSVLANSTAVRGIGFDRSPAALRVADRNVSRLGLSRRAKLLCGDLLGASMRESFDLILSNPPYIPTTELSSLQPEVREHEPRLALDGGPDGLSLIRPLVSQAHRALKPGGLLAMEVALGQSSAVMALLDRAGYASVQTYKDLAGIERAVSGLKFRAH